MLHQQRGRCAEKPLQLDKILFLIHEIAGFTFGTFQKSGWQAGHMVCEVSMQASFITSAFCFSGFIVVLACSFSSPPFFEWGGLENFSVVIRKE